MNQHHHKTPALLIIDAVLLEDCSAAPSRQLHEQTLDSYRRNALYPLLRVAKSTDLIGELLEKH